MSITDAGSHGRGRKPVTHIGSVRPASSSPSFTPWQYQSSCSRVCFGQAAEFAVQIAIQAGPAEKDIHLQQLGLVGDPLGRLAAGDGAGEIHLRRPIDRMHVAPGVERFAPRRRFDVRHAVLIALRP